MQSTSNFLTRNQKDILKARHRQERDKRLYDRIKTILLLNDGWEYDAIANVLLLDDDTIRRYHKTYLEGDKDALLNTQGRLADSIKISLCNTGFM